MLLRSCAALFQESVGAVDYLEGQLLLKAYDKGNSENTIDYLRYLLNESADQRLLIFWDGATYHRSKQIGGFLEEVNQTLPSDEWKIHCVQKAPNCPEQNPRLGYLVTSQNMGSTFLCFDTFLLRFEVDGRSGLFDTLLLILPLFRCTELVQNSNRIPIQQVATNVNVVVVYLIEMK